MKRKNTPRLFRLSTIVWLLSAYLLTASAAQAYPVNFTDDRGTHVTIESRPTRVVSLVPSVTEALFRIGAGDTVKGITYHETYPPETVRTAVIGGFFSPSVERIKRVQPEIIFISDLHRDVIDAFKNEPVHLIHIHTDGIADSIEDIRLLGRIFDCRDQAASVIESIRRDLDLIRRKVSGIPWDKRKRVIRLMGRDRVMTPGKDSFQNELIRAAGGISPDFTKEGPVVEVTLEQWKAFNPQVVYGCGGDEQAAGKFFNQPGWKDVEAVKNGQIYYFPCDLTCRASTNTGYFVSWLASAIYTEEFSNETHRVLPEKIIETRAIQLPLDYVKSARIATSTIEDFINKTLIIDFSEPIAVVSTLEGQRTGIRTVANHYSSPPCWSLGHHRGLETIRKRILNILGTTEESASFLFTGADMENLSIQRQSYRDMTVFALVTAGVRTNAVRMAKDEAGYYEPGTINVIVMTNMALSPRAMTRAVISATEGKAAALFDMDVRSAYTPLPHRATGTGTDEIIVVQGAGSRVDNAGGHSKLGELIARAVYAGVTEAVFKQNGIETKRNVFHRLKERKMTVLGLVGTHLCDCIASRSDFASAVEAVLLDPRYAGFMESALAVSDDHQAGLIQDLTAFEDSCRRIAEEIAEKPIGRMEEIVAMDDLPKPLGLAVNAVLNGVYFKLK